MKTKTDPKTLPTTVAVAARVSRELGIEPALSERALNGMLRTWPADALPIVVGTKRRWTEADVDRVRQELVARRARERASA